VGLFLLTNDTADRGRFVESAFREKGASKVECIDGGSLKLYFSTSLSHLQTSFIHRFGKDFIFSLGTFTYKKNL